MNNQQPQDNNLLNFDEAKTAIEKGFGSIIGTLGINNALLEKQLAASQQIVSKLTENEIILMERIQELGDEIAKLRYQLSSVPQPLSPEGAELAAEGRAVIQGNKDDEGKEKADP
jgi:dynactin complex subunit